MRIAEYKQIDTEIVENVILVDDVDENGEVTGQHEEVVTKEIPVMGMVYRDMTEEEEAEHERLQAEMPEPEPTLEEKYQQLEEKINEILGFQNLILQQIDAYQFEVLKNETETGDFTDPIKWSEGVEVEEGKFYYEDDKELPHEAIAGGTPASFDDRNFFDWIEE